MNANKAKDFLNQAHRGDILGPNHFTLLLASALVYALLAIASALESAQESDFNQKLWETEK